MKMNVWILNHYATDMYFNQGGRHYWFAKYLRRSGYSPVIFCAGTVHNRDKTVELSGNLYLEKASDIDVPFVFVKARQYTGNGKARVLNMLDYYRNVMRTCRAYASAHNVKPDVIYASSVHPLALVAGIKLAKHFGVKCVCEVRDLWPESLVAFDAIKSGAPLLKLLYAGEKWIYQKADRLIFTMEGGKDYIIEKGWDKGHGGPVDTEKVYHINNGVDLEAFEYNREHHTLGDEDLDHPDTFKVVYTGSIRQVNKLGMLVGAAEKLKSHEDIVFLIYGDGTEREELESYCKANGLENVKFKGRVDKKYIPYVVSRSDLNVSNSAENSLLGKYGWSLNKMFDYLASGKPMLTTYRMYYSLFDRFACGKSVNVSVADDYAKEILYFKELDGAARRKMCEEARRGAVAYDFKVLTEKLIEVLEG